MGQVICDITPFFTSFVEKNDPTSGGGGCTLISVLETGAATSVILYEGGSNRSSFPESVWHGEDILLEIETASTGDTLIDYVLLAAESIATVRPSGRPYDPASLY